MAQLSRPYQMALAAVLLIGLVWAVALRGHSNPSEPAPSSPPSTPSANPNGSATSSTSSVYHGAAPGVEGLTRDVAKAHEAVKTSEANAQQLQRKSSEATQEAPASTTGATRPTHASTAPRTHTGTRSHTAPQSKAPPEHSQTAKPSKPTGARSSDQTAVESEVEHGKTVMLLFWDPQSLLDQEVRTQADALARHSKQDVMLHVARASQVGQFGPITEIAHVYETPTILIVNKHGVVSTLTGLTDVFSLEHAVREARKAVA